MSDPHETPMREHLNRLEAAIEDAIARRDVQAYWSARVAYQAALDQLEAQVFEGSVDEVERGLADIEEHLRLEALFVSDPVAYWQHVAKVLRSEREARMRRDRDNDVPNG